MAGVEYAAPEAQKASPLVGSVHQVTSEIGCGGISGKRLLQELPGNQLRPRLPIRVRHSSLRCLAVSMLRCRPRNATRARARASARYLESAISCYEEPLILAGDQVCGRVPGGSQSIGQERTRLYLHITPSLVLTKRSAFDLRVHPRSRKLPVPVRKWE